MMDDAELVRKAQEVLEGVTPGPWAVPSQPDKICAEGYTKNGAAKTVATVTMPAWMTGEEWSANANFIAWAREGVPALIATVTAQAALIAERDAARDAALEEAAEVADECFKQNSLGRRDLYKWGIASGAQAIAVAVRALKGKSHE